MATRLVSLMMTSLDGERFLARSVLSILPDPSILEVSPGIFLNGFPQDRRSLPDSDPPRPKGGASSAVAQKSSG